MRTPIAEGLLSAPLRQGTIVQPGASWRLFDTDVLRRLLERRFSIDLRRHSTRLRIAIEPEAAALAVRFGSDGDRRRIAAGLEAAERGEDDMLDAEIAFRVAIPEAARNPFYARRRDVVATAPRTSIRFASVADHGAAARAIATGDARAARIAMHRLIGGVLARIDEDLPIAAAA